MKDIFITTMIQSAEPQNNEFNRRYGFTYTSGKGSQQDHVSIGNKPGIQISIDHFPFSTYRSMCSPVIFCSSINFVGVIPNHFLQNFVK